jgi:translation initiation factor IF-3
LSKDNSNQTRINEQIRTKEVRLISQDGEQLGIVPTTEAIEKALDLGLDLVEVAANADPPVCKIMNYGKYKYQMTKKEAKSRKHQKQIQIKEMKFRPRTDEHDYNFKLKHIQRFLEKGNHVKVHVHFRGREITHQELGKELLDRVAVDIGDIAEVEGSAKIEGRNMTMLLVPKKE